MNNAYDAIVIGAGIIGTSAAYYLTKAGQKVLVLEKNEIASGSTGSCNGGLSYFGKQGKELLWAKESLELYQEIGRNFKNSIEIEQGRDIYLIAKNDEEESYIDQLIAACQQVKLSAEKLNKQELLRRVTCLSHNFQMGAVANGGLHGFVNTHDFSLKLLEYVVAQGGVVKTGCKVLALIKKHGAVVGVQTSDGIIYSEAIVNATANAANELMPDRDLGLEPYQGIVLVTEQTPFNLPGNILSANFFQHIDGIPNLAIEETLHHNLLIGSSRKLEGRVQELDYNTIISIVKNALSYLPCLAELEIIRIFAGIRPQRKAGILLGEDEELKNLFWAIGFSSMGITLAPYAGKTIAKMIIER
ncbi:MAG: FAD-dependent oxidoreductase [Clostridia bacterium]